ncbi:hypothetical protein E3P91_03227 [Wallemia ichthyophaga]|nr:hypothetical protein E3P91_03227 [Wallemia ichthyophaga]
MINKLNSIFTIVILLALCPASMCFGSGDISEISGLEDRAYRHGDIDNTLLELLFTVGSSSVIKSFLKKAFTGSSGKKFDVKNVKRVYFGNWTRDLSQAMDVSTLTKFSPSTITSIVAVLGFLSFGYGSREFEVNEEILGCYRPEEHIDNPKNYADAPEGSPREITGYDKLRGGLVDGELDFDERTGMKNYIANEEGDWDTSSEYIRKNLIESIELGREARNGGTDEQMWHALYLLGRALHCVEDWPAHSNTIEVTLQSLGYSDVFTHVGSNVRVEAPDGRMVSPIVTGTFGGADFLHSLLGEATDKLSSQGIGDLSTTLSQNRESNKSDRFRKLLAMLLKSKDKGEADNDDEEGHPSADDTVNKLDDISRHTHEDSIDESEVRDIIRQLINIHDDIARTIDAVIEKVPFISDILDEASNTLQVFIFSTLEPVLSPILKDLKDVMFEASACVVDDDSQREVFDDPDASDPTHSMLAKDHFGNVLNAPAGRLAKLMITHIVNAVVKDGWDGEADPSSIADEALQALHHPDFQNGSAIQEDMMQFVKDWIESQGEEKDEVLRRLERDSVLEHRNTTDGLSGGSMNPTDQEKYGKYYGASQGLQGLAASGALDGLPGGEQLSEGLTALQLGGGDTNESVERSRYGSNNPAQYRSSHEDSGEYANESYGSGFNSGNEYRSGNHYQYTGYGGQQSPYGGGGLQPNYGNSGYGGPQAYGNPAYPAYPNQQYGYGYTGQEYGNAYGQDSNYYTQ